MVLCGSISDAQAVVNQFENLIVYMMDGRVDYTGGIGGKGTLNFYLVDSEEPPLPGFWPPTIIEDQQI